MRRVIKIILSIPIYFFYFLALADVLSGGEPLIDEFIILGLGFIWTAYLIKPFKAPKFLVSFLIFLISVVLHNVISHLLKTEEACFFIIALLSFLASFILCLTFIFKKFKAGIVNKIT